MPKIFALLLTACTLLAADPPATNPRLVNPTVGGVIPYFADGGGWTTQFTFTCLSEGTCAFRLGFIGSNGTNASTTIRITPPSGVQTTLTQPSINTTIGFGQTLLVETLGASSDVRTGGVDVTTTALLAAFSTFRQRVAGRPDNEATVLMESREFTNRFIVSFDNRDGFGTGVAVTNLANSFAANIVVTGVDQANGTLFTRNVQLNPLNATTFDVASSFPETAGKNGLLQFTSSTVITGTGFRFNPTGAFTTLPIFQLR